MTKRVISTERTELRLHLRRLYLEQSAYYAAHKTKSPEIDGRIEATREELKIVDAASIYTDVPRPPRRVQS